MVKYLRDQGKKTAAVLYENDAAGIGGRDDFVAALAQGRRYYRRPGTRPVLGPD